MEQEESAVIPQPQVPVEHYVGEYNSLDRFISYAYQVEYIRATRARTILIIGVGDGIVPHLLKQDTSVEVTTCDIDSALHPDVTADIRALPFPDNTFDLVVACEVLEHLPWEESKRALHELARVSHSKALVSVPHRRTGFEVVLKFPFIRTLIHRDFVRLAFLFPIKFGGFEESGQHYWEIDGRSTKLASFRMALRASFAILSEKTAVLDPYRRFFLLQKS